MPTKAAADNHKRSRASVAQWNQFSTANRHRILGIADFNNHQHSDPAYELSVHPISHPAHSTNIRRLVTYPSKNHLQKDCRYGTYQDGRVVKCLRNPLHAPPGASHRRGAHTGNPIGRPRDEEEPVQPPPRQKRARNSPSTGPAGGVAAPRRSNRLAARK